MQRITIGCVVALALVLGGGGAAFAGETGGHGQPVPGADNANSACAYSGRDLPDGTGPGFENNENPALQDDDFVTGGHVQSYGQWVRAGHKADVPSPGVACRGGVEFGG